MSAPEAWRLYAGDELVADLVVTRGDFPWLHATVEANAGFERYRDLFAKELAASEAAAETDSWSAADIYHYRIRAELRLVAPDGREVPEFLLHVDESEAWWRWSDEPFDEAPLVPLWRPVGQAELDLIEQSGWSCFPPRLPGQPIFYPVLSEDYATKIARDWNTKDPASGHVGHVLRFDVEADYVARFEPRRVGGAGIDELWVPAEELEEFNRHIVGRIELIASFP
jgi:hypothetical protein